MNGPLVLDIVLVSDTVKMYQYQHIDTVLMVVLKKCQYILSDWYFFQYVFAEFWEKLLKFVPKIIFKMEKGPKFCKKGQNKSFKSCKAYF